MPFIGIMQCKSDNSKASSLMPLQQCKYDHHINFHNSPKIPAIQKFLNPNQILASFKF